MTDLERLIDEAVEKAAAACWERWSNSPVKYEHDDPEFTAEYREWAEECVRAIAPAIYEAGKAEGEARKSRIRALIEEEQGVFDRLSGQTADQASGGVPQPQGRDSISDESGVPRSTVSAPGSAPVGLPTPPVDFPDTVSVNLTRDEALALGRIIDVDAHSAIEKVRAALSEGKGGR